jgi:hypothetical protein
MGFSLPGTHALRPPDEVDLGAKATILQFVRQHLLVALMPEIGFREPLKIAFLEITDPSNP